MILKLFESKQLLKSIRQLVAVPLGLRIAEGDRDCFLACGSRHDMGVVKVRPAVATAMAGGVELRPKDKTMESCRMMSIF